MSQYRNLFNSLDVAFCVVEVLFDENKKAVDFRHLELNEAYEKQTGLVNASGKTARELVPGLEGYWFELYDQVLRTGKATHYENIVKELGRYYDVYAYPFGEPGENKVAVIFNDIKEKKETLDKLQRAESLYRNTLDNMLEGCAIIDYDWNYLYANNELAKQCHMQREEIIGRKLTELFPGVEEIDFYKACKNCMEKREVFKSTSKYTFPDGSIGWYETTAQPITDGIFVLSIEITEKKKAEIKLEQTLQILRENEEKLSNAMRTAKMGHIEFDLISGEIFWSDEVFRIYERPLESGPPTLDEALSYVYPEDKERVMTVVQSAFSGQVLEIDYRIVLTEGRIKHLAYHMKPIFEGGKQVRRVGTIQDITDRKIIEMKLQQKVEEKEVLLKELYHRIKNNMQIISSLLTLRAESITNDEDRSIFFKMKNHVLAMSMVHEKLYQSKNLTRINLGSYIKELAESMFSFYYDRSRNINVSYNLHDIEVLMDTALPCGFAVTELIHNILKYAFPGNRKGNVAISLFKSDDNEIILVISDDGIGISHSDLESDSLGLILVKTLVQEQLCGEITLENTKGTCWQFKIKNQSCIDRI